MRKGMAKVITHKLVGPSGLGHCVPSGWFCAVHYMLVVDHVERSMRAVAVG